MKKLRIVLSFVLAFILLFHVGASTAAVSIYNDFIGDSGLLVDNDNLTPVADFSFTKKQKVQLVFVLGSGTYALSTVQYKITSLINPVLTEKSIELSYSIINSDNALNTILPGITWDESSERYYISINNGTYPELSNLSSLVDVINGLGQEQVAFIGMGNSTNQSTIEKLISNNSGKGFFVSNASIDTAFTKLANYIAGNINVELFFNIGLGPVTADIVKAKYESIVKPKLVANDISTNVNINTGTYNTVIGAKIAASSNYNNRSSGLYSDSYTRPLILKPDGTLWNLVTQTRVAGENGVGYLSNVVDMSCSIYDYFAVDSAGNAYTWKNSGTPTYPVRIPGGDTGQTYLGNVIKLSANDTARYALRGDGTVWYWGYGGFENKNKTCSWSIAAPTQAKLENGSALANIVQIAAGGESALALDKNGNLYLLSGSTCPKVSGSSIGPHVHTNSLLIDTQVSIISAATTELSNSPNHDGNSNLVYLKRDGSVWMLTYKNWVDDDYVYYPGGDDLHQLYSNSKAPQMLDIFASHYYVYGFGAGEKLYKLYSFPGYGRYGNYGSSGEIYTMATFGDDDFYYLKNNGDVWHEFRDNNATFTGFNASVSGAYPYNDVISSAPFKDVNDQYFVELSNAVLPELSDSTALSKIMDILNTSDIRTVGIGSSSNATQLQYINTLNGRKGAYFDISNIDTAMNGLADYIISNSMRPPRQINDYFLVSEDIDAPTTFYSDIESDPYYNMWIYEHNPTNFYTSTGSTVPLNNSAGYFSLDRKVLSYPVTSFIDTDNFGGKVEKVGGYKVKYQVQDNPKAGNANFANYNRDSNVVTKYLNLHRKPVANYTVNATDDGTNYIITLSDNTMSYDLDHTSRTDKGIAKRLWGIATISADGKLSWQYSKGNDLTKTYKVPKGGRYIVSLSVQDIDGPYGLGAWSDPQMAGIPGRPVALFNISPNPLPVSQTSTVTDLSYVTMPGYTITQRRWNIKKVGSSTFSYANQPTCKTNYADSGVGNYEITLEVMDSGGTWSLPFTKTLTVIDTIPPQIRAVPSSRPWSNTEAQVTLSAHDDGGSGLKRIDYVWTVAPSDISAYSSRNATGSDFDTQTSQSANGKWYLCARAMDNSDNYSNNGSFEVFGTYNIDKIAPTVSSSLDPGTYQDSVTAAIIASDSGGSGIRSIRYKWTNSTAEPASGWTSANIAQPEDNSESLASTIDMEGTWYLHMQVTDYAGNSAYKWSGPVIIQDLSITDIKIEGYWNHWRGQVDMLGKRLTNEPHRFLSLECVRINIDTTGEPDRVTVRFSPELEAMEFTDPNGHIYNYSDYFGREISFPEDSTFTASRNNVYWEYNLPLAPSSKDWNDNRLRPQYSLTVTAYKGARFVTRTINDIDITGNIYDLTYIQPRD